jgi:hypothetical protein|tara:strand:- start:77 stop:739 length:663 start_codon:yes stop_codon:yes gene_type:complete
MKRWAIKGLTAKTKQSFRYGQFGQDVFVNRLLDMDEGFFLDIGAGVSDLDAETVLISTMSNTYGLEQFRDWNGIAIDYDEKYIQEAKKFRSCIMICEDLMEVNINDILQKNNAPKKIDYLSFDVDDAQEKVFNELDFSVYSFRIITYEHNLYRGHSQSHEKSRRRFKDIGYKLLFGNVGADDRTPVEDWYVDHQLFDKYNHLMDDNSPSAKIIQTLEQKI